MVGISYRADLKLFWLFKLCITFLILCIFVALLLLGIKSSVMGILVAFDYYMICRKNAES